MSAFTQEELKTARNLCKQAESYLIRAYKNPNDRQLILKSIDIYQDLIAKEMPLADPYIGLAYLVFSQGNLEKALSILLVPKSLGVVDVRLDRVQTRMFKMHQNRVERTLAKRTKKMKKVASMKGQEQAASAGALDLEGILANQELSVTLEKGAEGDDVIRLQAFLKARGLLRGEPNGKFDTSTSVAVKAFQIKNKLPPSGNVDQVTLDAINQSNA